MTFRIQDYESIDIYPIIQDRFNWLVKLRRRRLVIQICAAHVKPLLLKTIFVINYFRVWRFKDGEIPDGSHDG